MELKFRHSESTVEPSSLEVSKHTVFLRRNILKDDRIDSDGNTTVFWTYEEAKLSLEEFNEYAKYVSVQSALSGANDSNNILRIIDGQATGDDNQLIIMEAIADLYDAIAMLQLGGTEE